MAWRWRKIFNLGGGFRAIMSRGGIGYSWGFPGFRIGKGADGSTWISVGIPGTGLYFTKRLRPRSDSKEATSDSGTNDLQTNRKSSLVKRWRDIR